jgi:hypothetical protein
MKSRFLGRWSGTMTSERFEMQNHIALTSLFIEHNRRKTISSSTISHFIRHGAPRSIQCNWFCTVKGIW